MLAESTEGGGFKSLKVVVEGTEGGGLKALKVVVGLKVVARVKVEVGDA